MIPADRQRLCDRQAGLITPLGRFVVARPVLSFRFDRECLGAPGGNVMAFEQRGGLPRITGAALPVPILERSSALQMQLGARQRFGVGARVKDALRFIENRVALVACGRLLHRGGEFDQCIGDPRVTCSMQRAQDRDALTMQSDR